MSKKLIKTLHPHTGIPLSKIQRNFSRKRKKWKKEKKDLKYNCARRWTLRKRNTISTI